VIIFFENTSAQAPELVMSLKKSRQPSLEFHLQSLEEEVYQVVAQQNRCSATEGTG
jgi:hypothetical protein